MRLLTRFPNDINRQRNCQSLAKWGEFGGKSLQLRTVYKLLVFCSQYIFDMRYLTLLDDVLSSLQEYVQDMLNMSRFCCLNTVRVAILAIFESIQVIIVLHIQRSCSGQSTNLHAGHVDVGEQKRAGGNGAAPLPSGISQSVPSASGSIIPSMRKSIV